VRIESGDRLCLADLHAGIRQGRHLKMKNLSRNFEMAVEHALTERQIGILLKGGLINLVREKLMKRSKVQ
jgi:aconitate hydratase